METAKQILANLRTRSAVNFFVSGILLFVFLSAFMIAQLCGLKIFFSLFSLSLSLSNTADWS